MRKRFHTHHHYHPSLHMEYMSGSKRTEHAQGFHGQLTESLQGQMIEERSDVVFKNGAVYKG